jgi:hypothetical protein
MQKKQTSEKRFDAVATMRHIRVTLTRELEGKSFEEVRRYLREHVPETSAEEQLQGTSTGR